MGEDQRKVEMDPVLPASPAAAPPAYDSGGVAYGGVAYGGVTYAPGVSYGGVGGAGAVMYQPPPPGVFMYPQWGSQPAILVPVGLPQEPPVRIRDYLGCSIVNLLCCCFVFGIFGVVKSLEVQSLVNNRDYAYAQTASLTARKVNVIGIAVGSVLWALGLTTIIVLLCMQHHFVNSTQNLAR
eukprot:TRINITY_DN3789_c0_g1_i1.p1 TRINITY_DN3789_c0_g1~~TRINITY_DN3789_c0_g1_i1.p1  ORF type:complete len:200 (-),score=56.04 TRINITY_DN3789_c0_g1_i1:40-585(-)